MRQAHALLTALMFAGCGGAGASATLDGGAGSDAAASDGAASDGAGGGPDGKVADGGQARDGGTIQPSPTQPTRLRITSNCDAPIWLAHSDNLTEPQNVMLARGQSHDYQIPTGGLAAMRLWPKLGCDAGGHACQTGDNGEGGGKPCPATGCQPPVDSKLEASFGANQAGAATWYNLSQVDGYTIPFSVYPKGAGVGTGTCGVSDCSHLALSGCPGNEDISGGGAFPAYGNLDLRIHDPADPSHIIGCLSPCKKWNYPAPYGLGQPESNDPGLHMCCPTPIDPAQHPGQCTVANHCMTPEACRAAADPVSVVHTRYVAALHTMCPTAYSYSYDDAAGLHTCPGDTQFEVIFCP